ncbi:MAG: complex I subunit 5 family protein [Acidilobaceae archaeon]
MSWAELVVEYSLAITAMVVALELATARVGSKLPGLLSLLYSVVVSAGFGAVALDVVKRGELRELSLEVGLFSLPLVVTPISAPIILITCLVAPFISLYSINYLSYYGLPVGRFYPIYSATILSILVYFAAGDLVTFLIAMEVASILTGLLVAYKLGYEEISSALKYIFVFVAVDKLAIAGAGIAWAHTGSLRIPDSLALLGAIPDSEVAVLSLLLLLTAFITKATLAPMSFWLIWAMDAPSNVSALFHFGIIILMGVYGIALTALPALSSEKLALTAGCLVVLGGAVGAVIASAMMLVTRDVKHLVGLSTIENAGLTAVCLGGSIALLHTNPWLSSMLLATAYLHSLAHAYSKAAMFMSAGCLVTLAHHSREIDDLAGLSRLAPATGAFLALIALSMAGAPPSLMFASTLLIAASTLMAALEFMFMAVGFASVILAHVFASLAYLRLVKKVIFEEARVEEPVVVGDDAVMLAPQAGLMAASFASLALLPAISGLFEAPAEYLGLPVALPARVLEALSVAALATAIPALAVPIALALRKERW